jgi:hypothetical protein
MLAMGGYSGMQTYSVHRIRRGRDLPPFGVGPLWDALWALSQPGDERTRRILEENDVRYVVLGKHRRDDMDWRSFQSRKDLYRMVFENENVVIFEVREGQPPPSAVRQVAPAHPRSASSRSSARRMRSGSTLL